MRMLLILGTLFAALAVDVRPSRAQDYPWCAYYDWYTYNCGFTTFQQCLATIRGAGGWCQANPRYAPPRRSR